MGNNNSSANSSFQQQQQNNAGGSPEECLICLAALDPRGGLPLAAPGCCGKWFHQACIDQVRLSGNNSCPNCRVAFPGAAIAVPVVQTVPQPQIQVQPQIAPSSFMNRLSFRQNTIPPNPPAQRNSFFSKFNGSSVTGDLEEELLEKSEKKVEKKKLESEKTPESTLTVSCQAEKSELSINGNDGFFVNVTLRASSQDPELDFGRIPMDLVCVLDNSGSMSGSKLASVKEAMRFIRSRLTADDRLSVVNFNSNATTLHGLHRMTEPRKESSARVLDSLQATGGTSIYSGLQYAHNILSHRKTSNTISCVFLLTDGQDSSNMREKEELCAQMRSKGFSLFAFGFGADHDSAQLKSISAFAEGSYAFVEQDSMVVDAFGGALGGQQSLVARDVSLSITLSFSDENDTKKVEKTQERDDLNVTSKAGATLAQVFSGKYANRQSPDLKSVEVSFASLFAGESRDVLLKLQVPSCLSESERCLLLTARATYSSVEGESKQAVASPPDENTSDKSLALCCVRRVLEENPQLAVNEEVDAQKNRVIFLEAVERANTRARRGSFSGAQEELRACKEKVIKSVSNVGGNKFVQSIMDDLEVSEQTVQSKTAYHESGGAANLEEFSDNWGGQRQFYQKASRKTSAIQSMSSAYAQNSAMMFKNKK